MLHREKEANQQCLFMTNKSDALNHIKNKRGRKPTKKIEDILPPSQVTLDYII